MIEVLISMTLVVLALVAAFVLVTRWFLDEQAAGRTERAMLLQSIQAPAQAVVDRSLALMDPREQVMVPMDDDAAVNEAMGVRVSKEDLAEQAYMQELA